MPAQPSVGKIKAGLSLPAVGGRRLGAVGTRPVPKQRNNFPGHRRRGFQRGRARRRPGGRDDLPGKPKFSLPFL